MNEVRNSIFPTWMLNAIMYFCILAIPLAFYLVTYDSCQIKITILQIGGAIILATWLFRAMQDGKFTRQRWFWDLPALLYFGWGLIAFLNSPWKMSSSVDELIRLIYYFGIYLAASDYFSQDKKVRIISKLLLVTVAVAIVYGFMQFFGADPFGWGGAFSVRVFSTFGNPNFYAAFLVLTSPLILSHLFKTKNIAARIGFGVFFVANVISIFITGSKGGWLGIAGSLFVFSLLMTKFIIKSIQVKRLLISFTVAALLISAFGVYQYSKKRYDSLLFRLLTWHSTLKMVSLHPLIGNGLGTFRLIYPSYRDREIFRIEGKHQTETQHPENEYLEIANDQGVIGLGLYLWMLLVIFSRGLTRIKNYLTPSSTRGQALYLIGFTAGLAGLLAHNLFCVNLRFVSSGFFLWLFLGLIGGGCKAEPATKKSTSNVAQKDWISYILKPCIVIITCISIVFYVRFFMADYHHNMGIAYSKMHIWDEAVKEYQTSINLNPFFTMSRYFLGNAYSDRWQDGDAQRSLLAYDKVMKMAPNYVMVHYQRGGVLMKLGRYQEGVEEFNQSLKLDPVYAPTYFRLGLAYINLNQLDKALDYFEQSAKLDPNLADIYVNMGNIYFLQGKFSQAMQQYQKALSLDADNMNAHRNLGALYLKQNKAREALREFKIVQQMVPDNPDINKLVSSLSR